MAPPVDLRQYNDEQLRKLAAGSRSGESDEYQVYQNASALLTQRATDIEKGTNEGESNKWVVDVPANVASRIPKILS